MSIIGSEGWEMSRSAASDRWYYCYLPNGIANGATSLLVPLFAKELGATVGQVGLIAAVSSLASIPAFMLWGKLSDRMKRRKPFILIGFLGMALTLMLMGVSFSVNDYYLVNMLFGFLVAASVPVATVLMIETVSKEQWARRLAVFSQIGGIGWVSGLVLGAIWLQIDFNNLTAVEEMRTLFAIGAALALASGIVAWRLIKEPAERLEGRPTHLHEHHYITVERLKYMPMRMLHVFDFSRHKEGKQGFGKPLYIYLACIFLLFAGFTAFYAFFPIFLVDELGMKSSAIFIVYIASQATSVAFYTRVGGWVKDIGSKKMQLIASGARTVLFPSFLAVALFDIDPLFALAMVFILHALVGLCWAMINVSGSMIVSGLAPSELKGEAFGAYNAVQGLSAIAGPVAGGLVCQFFGYSAGFLLTSVFILLGMMVLIELRVDAK